jgi:hypothetical protein
MRQPPQMPRMVLIPWFKNAWTHRRLVDPKDHLEHLDHKGTALAAPSVVTCETEYPARRCACGRFGLVWEAR